MGGPSVLVVAAWGYPPAWRKARYTVTINHPAFKDAKPVECTTCSTTVALANYLAYKSRHVDVLIFGVDTVSTPAQGEDGGGFRERVKQQYEKWLQTLIETSKGCLTETSREKISWTVETLPGLGIYRGWRFESSPLLLFNAAAASILERIEKVDPSFIVVDLSHGVNYQTVSVLYATVAAAVIKNLEKQLLIFNSDPYPPEASSPTCVESEKLGKNPEEPSLNINDVTELQRAVRRIRQITALRRLQMPEMEERDQDETIRQLLACVCALANGAAALCFKGARYDDGTTPLSLPEPPKLSPPHAAPEVKQEMVRYPAPDPAYPVRRAVAEVIKELKKLRETDELVTFLNNVAKKYEELHMVQNSLVLRRTAEELGKVVQHYKDVDYVEVPAADLMSIIQRSKDTRSGEPDDIGQEESKDVKEQLERQKRDVREKKEEDVDWAVRNLLAHGGLSYVALQHITVKEKKIDEVIYDKDVLPKLINRLLKKCKINALRHSTPQS